MWPCRSVTSYLGGSFDRLILGSTSAPDLPTSQPPKKMSPGYKGRPGSLGSGLTPGSRARPAARYWSLGGWQLACRYAVGSAYSLWGNGFPRRVPPEAALLNRANFAGRG